ncbi:MAG: hypothetical protein Q4G41_03410 [Coriobacteriales bacterium]|nr:hypothetical protein [Coriobacteriales bacterium]MDO5709144.1 hypothetical protein [Coriobacteriales bacterium]
MRVLLVYNDGLIDSFDTIYDPDQEYAHAQLQTFVEETDEDGHFVAGIDLIPIVHTHSHERPTIRRICSASFSSDYPHGSRPSISKVCEMIDGLEKLIVNGSVIWEGDPAPYIVDDHYDNIYVERSER